MTLCTMIVKYEIYPTPFLFLVRFFLSISVQFEWVGGGVSQDMYPNPRIIHYMLFDSATNFNF